MQPVSSFDKIKDTLSQPLLAGGIAFLAGKMFYDAGDMNIPFTQMSVSLPLALGATVAGASLVSSFSKNYVLTMLPQNAAYADQESMWTGPLLTGGVSLLVLKYGSENYQWDKIGYVKAILLGAGSEIGGAYAAKAFGWSKNSSPVAY